MQLPQGIADLPRESNYLECCVKTADMRGRSPSRDRMRVCLHHGDNISSGLVEASRSAIEGSGIFRVSGTAYVPPEELGNNGASLSISEFSQKLAALSDPSCEVVVALVANDLRGPGDTPVFAAALRRSNSGRDVAVVSVRKLDPTRFGCPNEAFLARRVQKEVMHELGHILGLNHCPSYACVMRLSRNVSEIDMKPVTYCPMCLLRLVARRYCSRVGWLKRFLGRLTGEWSSGQQWGSRDQAR